jgi:hypothetical protein
MPKYVQVGSDVVEFPDNMSDAQIAQVLQQQTSERQRLLNMPYSEVVKDIQGTPSQEPVNLSPTARRAVGLVKGAFVDPFEAITQMVGGEAGRSAVAQREASYQQGRQQRGETGIEGARLIGNILSPVSNIPVLGVAQRAAQATSLGGKLAGGAATGAAGALLQPVSNDSKDIVDFASAKVEQLGIGAVLGGLVQGGIEGIKGGAKLIAELGKPLTTSGRNDIIRTYLDKLSGDDKQKFISALSRADEIVAGSRPTAAEALADVPEAVNMAAAQSRLARAPEAAPAFVNREAEQQAARLREIQSFGGTPEELSAAIAAREAATAPMRTEALQQANVAGQIAPRLEADVAAREASRINALQTQGQFQTRAAEQGVLARGPFTPVPGMPRVSSRYSPSIDRTVEAIEAAKDTGNIVAQRAAERDFKKLQLQSLADEGFFPLKVNDIVSNVERIRVAPGQRSSEVVTKTFDSLREKLTNPEYVKPNGIIDSRDLYTIRKEIGNDIKKFAQESQNWDARMTAGLEKNIKSYIDNAIESAGGVKWKDYLQNYSRYSTKINQMEIGQFLESKLNAPLDVERAGAFANAVREAASTIQRASGGPRFERLEQVLTPKQVESVVAVRDDLVRSNAADKLAARAKAVGVNAEELQLPQLLDRAATIANAVLRALRRDATEEINREMSKLFLDPKMMAVFMSSVPKSKAENFVSAVYSRLSPENQAILSNIVQVQAPVRTLTEDRE